MKVISLIFFLLIISCSEDSQAIEQCNCKVVKTTIGVKFVNGLPRTTTIITERDYPENNCDFDGFQLSDNEIVKCQ